MAHNRKRYLSERLNRAIRYSPITGIIGQRQVGKTTLLLRGAAETVTLDKEQYLRLADSDPDGFLEGHRSPFGIDEIQLCPKLFPALKVTVQENKRPGQFLLSGSVRFTSKKDIRESLTGRIVTLELLPFTVAEALEEPLPRLIETLLKITSEKQLTQFISRRSRTPLSFSQYLDCGGLPGICFFRDRSIRNEKWEAHLNTTLTRDIREIYPTTILYPSLRRLLAYLAHQQGRPLNLSQAARESQISTVTLPKLLFALEGLFLIRPVEIRGIHRTTYFLEDQGMATWLMHKNAVDTADIMRGLYANLRQEVHYRPENGGEIFRWTTRNGADVSLAFVQSGKVLGIQCTPDKVPTPKLLRSAASFQRTFPNAQIVIAYGGVETRLFHKKLIWIPYWKLL